MIVAIATRKLLRANREAKPGAVLIDHRPSPDGNESASAWNRPNFTSLPHGGYTTFNHLRHSLCEFLTAHSARRHQITNTG